MSETFEPTSASGPQEEVGGQGDWIARPDELEAYRIVGRPVAGGEGWTYETVYRQGQRRAVKQLRRPPQAGAEWPSTSDLARWQDVMTALATVDNEHLVRVLEVFAGPPPRPAGTRAAAGARRYAYVVMEWLEGSTLENLLRNGEIDRVEAVKHVYELASAVSALHSSTQMDGTPLIHLDIKPANCVVTADRGLVLVDIGTMRLLGEGPDPRRPRSLGYTAPEYTRAPERSPAPAADHYALGAVTYFCLVGEVPPGDMDSAAVRASARQRVERAAAEIKVPRTRLGDLVMGMLAADPADRSSPAPAELLEAITPERRRRRTLMLVAGAAVIGVVLAFSLVMGNEGGTSSTPVSSVPNLAPFGASHASFTARQAGDSLQISPPLGTNRYDFLWGMSTGPGLVACGSVVDFDVTMDPSADRESGFGVGVAPRSSIDADQPSGSSVQYEWVPRSVSSTPGSRIRPALLPGGAWNARTQPVMAPDVGATHHVHVIGEGKGLEMTVDGVRASYDVPRVECGGVAIRAWGTSMTIRNLRIKLSA
ncbi:protein kinase domain-containing protein [Actinomycetospora sp. TBRC 11914]|uniref:protein kinase domain-containing protein n=1 Tax=Actinomycetospora sp. TBRC 11914 TaxID=2729387 RepID=UPI00145F20A1|nr:protein kinase [Actinomycetospora sp. TBRC 11914]NMO93921.1 protein kinase [Actinomycetospora sp. TBRC 11914]